MGFVDKGVELPEDKCSLTVSKYWSWVDTTVALPLSAGRNLKSDLRNFRDLRAVRCCGVKLSRNIFRLASNSDNTEVT